MVPPETQCGASSANGPMNGSFLVLNLGTNTVSLGNSFQFPLPQNASQRPINPNPNAASNSDTTATTDNSNSTDEGSSILNARKRRGVSDDDPDWVPEKKGRKSGSITCRTARPKTGASASEPLVSSLANGSGASSSNDSSVIFSSNANGLPVSRSGPPPQYLVSLLSFFGWKVVHRHTFGDYVYISPAGLAYFSLPKAFEIFLHGTSKYKGKAGASSPCPESIGLATTLGSNSGMEGGAAAGESSKKVNGTSKMSSEPLRPGLHPFSGNSNLSLQMPGMLVPQGENHDVSFCTVDGKTRSSVGDGGLVERHKQMDCSNSLYVENNLAGNTKTKKYGRLLGVRRSTSLSGRHVLLESQMDSTRASSDYSFISECVLSLDALGNKENQMSVTSQAEQTLDKTSTALTTDGRLNCEVKKSDFSSMGAVNNAQINRGCIFKDRKLAGARKSWQINGKKEFSGQEVDAEIRVETGCSASTESVANISARQDGDKSEFILDRKTCSHVNGKVASSELKTSDCSTMVSSERTQINGNNTQQCRIRRSMRINGKHVHVDDGLDLDLVAGDSSMDVSECRINDLEKERNQLRTSLFEVGEMEVRNPAPDDTVWKKTAAEQSDCHKEKALVWIESEQFWKIDKEKQLRSEKCPSSMKDIEIKVPTAETKSLSSAARRKLFRGGKLNGKKRKKRNGGCGLIIMRNEKDGHHEVTSSQTKFTILSWLIDSGSLSENEKVVYIRKNSSGNLFCGLVTRGGIWCNCCKNVVPLLEFEAHAGSSLHQPWDNILCLSGKSLMQCLRDAWEKEKKKKNIGFQTIGIDDPDPSDDTCGVCADGGRLICCDSCPSTFHQECMMLKALPEGSWYCPYCRCTYCKNKSDAANETLKLLACKQCGRKYHRECAWKNETCGMNTVPILFCKKSCVQLASQLSDLLGSENPIEGGYSWTLLKRLDEDEGVSSDKRRSLIAKSNAKLSVAFSVLSKCFVPLRDQRTGVDMICQAVYNCGSNFNRLNYEGFYTVILEKEEETITVASLRFHGTHLAEMPFIGTRPMYRKQGMCRRLIKAIEDMLSSLCIEKLIIPAIPDLLEMWTTSFSFKPLEPSHEDEIRNLSMMIFAETTLLQKPIFNTGAMEQEVSTKFDVCPSHDRCMQKMIKPSIPFGGQINSGGCDTGGQDWRSHDPTIKAPWTSSESSEPCRMHEDSSFGSNLFAILHPEVSNKSISETSPVQSTSIQNMDPRLDRDNSIVGSGTFSVEDLIEDAIRCGFPIESLFRIRS